MENKDLIEKYVKSLEWLRDSFLSMDELINPVMGIRDWDDACCINFSGKLVASTDGPYAKRLVMKSALVHSATDVVVKGAKPLFALDTLTGTDSEIRDMAGSLKKQSLEMKIPILGGNTMLEDTGPRCSLTIIGKLIPDEPIRDCVAKEDDVLVLLGEPIWGGQDERLMKAKKLFETWFEIIGGGIKINAAKDVTKGGLVSCIYEISVKSGVEFKLNSNSARYPLTRNLDNFLISVSDENYNKIQKVCEKNNCEILVIGKSQKVRVPEMNQ